MTIPAWDGERCTFCSRVGERGIRCSGGGGAAGGVVVGEGELVAVDVPVDDRVDACLGCREQEWEKGGGAHSWGGGLMRQVNLGRVS